MMDDRVEPKDTENVVDQGLQVIARRNSQHRKMRVVFSVVWLAWALCIAAYYFARHNFHNPLTNGAYLMYLVLGLSYLVGQVFLERRAIRALAETDDIRAVVPL